MKNFIPKILLAMFFAVFLLAVSNLSSQPVGQAVLSGHSAQSRLWEQLLDHDDTWFLSDSAHIIADNILLFQRDSGGWPKNINFSLKLTETQKLKLSEYPNELLSTIDNGATYTQLFFLAKYYQFNQDKRYILSFLKGVDFLLNAQYKNGGWPQYFPLRKGYYTHITYNDDAMVGVLFLLHDVIHSDAYEFVDQNRRHRIKRALDKGIDCILKTQIKVDEKLTGWCAQHDETTLEPQSARIYEKISISSKESVGVLRFLMVQQHPSQKIINSVQNGISWLNCVKLDSIRQVRKPDPKSPTGLNKVVIVDPKASPLWARFYEIGTNKPIFSDRDGGIYDNMSQISYERRNAYGWLGDWPALLLRKEYPKWIKKHAIDKNVLELEVFDNE